MKKIIIVMLALMMINQIATKGERVLNNQGDQNFRAYIINPANGRVYVAYNQEQYDRYQARFYGDQNDFQNYVRNNDRHNQDQQEPPAAVA